MFIEIWVILFSGLGLKSFMRVWQGLFLFKIRWWRSMLCEVRFIAIVKQLRFAGGPVYSVCMKALCSRGKS